MTKCEKCGSTNITAHLPVEFLIQQRPDGTWVADGYEDVQDKAQWFCADCDYQWEDWFTEPYLDREDVDDDDDPDEPTGPLPEERR